MRNLSKYIAHTQEKTPNIDYQHLPHASWVGNFMHRLDGQFNWNKPYQLLT